jgi:hypothetical protein
LSLGASRAASSTLLCTGGGGRCVKVDSTGRRALAVRTTLCFWRCQRWSSSGSSYDIAGKICRAAAEGGAGTVDLSPENEARYDA